MSEDQFEVVPVQMVKLYRNGQPVVDERGKPVLYRSFDDAMHVAANWDKFRPPSYAELRAMSDEELIRRAYPDHEEAEASRSLFRRLWPGA